MYINFAAEINFIINGQKNFFRILQHCHSVMFRQVFCWMMNGFVEDPYKEFFIQPDTTTKEKTVDIFMKSYGKESNVVIIIFKFSWVFKKYCPCKIYD